MSSSTTSGERQAGTLQGLTLLFPITLSVMGALLIAPVIPQMMAAFHDVPGFEFLVPMVVTLPSLCVALFSPLAGWLGDRSGRRKLMIAAMIVYSIVGVAPFLLNDLKLILASRVLVGLSEAIVMTMSTTLIGDFFSGHRRDRWLASQTAVASVSALLFLAIGGFMGKLFGWHGPFLIYAFPLILALGVVLFTWEPTAAAATPGPNQEARAKFPWAWMGLICAVTLFGSVMFYVVQIHFSVALTALGLTDPGKIGLYTAAASLGVPAGTFLFQGISRRLNVGGQLLVGFGLLGLGFVAMSYTRDHALFITAAAINQIGAGVVLPTVLTWAMRGLAFEVRGRGTGIWQSTFALGQFVSGLLMPLLSRQFGGILPVFQVLGFVCLAAAIVALTLALNGRRGDKALRASGAS